FPRAVVHYEAIAEQSPGSGPAWLNLGVAYKGAGRFEEAQKAYQRAAAIEQTAPAAQFNLGVLYLRHLDRLEEAQTALRQYMSLTGVDDREAMVLLEEAEQLQRFKTTSAEESAPSVDRSTTETTPSREAPSAASESSTPAVPPRSVSKPRNSPVKKTKPVAKPVPEVPEPDDFE
ncbi:MAG: tetratricopeptide repeat protein, partial [Myxococcota bacterium]